MLIEGPIDIAIDETFDGPGKVLTISFLPEFQGLEVTAQGEEFRSYLQQLKDSIDHQDTDEKNRAGMLIVQQIAEQLLPHIVSGELALEESMSVQIGQREQVLALTDLLKPRH